MHEILLTTFSREIKQSRDVAPRVHRRKPADYKEDTVSSKTPERCKLQQVRWRREVRSGNENTVT